MNLGAVIRQWYETATNARHGMTLYHSIPMHDNVIRCGVIRAKCGSRIPLPHAREDKGKNGFDPISPFFWFHCCFQGLRRIDLPR